MSPIEPALIAELRERLALLPRARLAALPTPTDDCVRLSSELGGPRILVKRDDLTGLAFGGNKVRQHEYMLGDAIAAGADCFIQGSASQSNHSRQIAGAGAKLGIETHLIPLQDAHSEPVQGNYLVDHLLGAHVHPVPVGTSLIEAKEQLAATLRSAGKTPYIVGMGSQDALELAAVAYVEAMCEIIEQMGHVAPDYVYTTSQGSTQAGLLLACRYLGASTRVVGIGPLDERHEAFITKQGILELAHGAARRLGLAELVELDDIEHDTNHVGEAYGVPSQAGLDTLRLLATTEGILLDPVYTAKGFSGLLHHIQTGRVTADATVVFLHTGGLPALFEYAEDLMKGLPVPSAAVRTFHPNTTERRETT